MSCDHDKPQPANIIVHEGAFKICHKVNINTFKIMLIDIHDHHGPTGKGFNYKLNQPPLNCVKKNYPAFA